MCLLSECCPHTTILSGIVPLDSLVRVLLSSSEFEPRLSTDDIRVLMSGLQVAFSNRDSILDYRVLNVCDHVCSPTFTCTRSRTAAESASSTGLRSCRRCFRLRAALSCDFEWIGVDFGVWQEMKEEQQKPLAKHAADSSSSVAVVLDGQVCDLSPLCILPLPPLDASPLQQPIFRREINADPKKHLVHLDRNRVRSTTQSRLS